MNEEKTQELLLRLLEDMAYVKAKLDNIDEQKLGSRIDGLEMITERQEKQIKSLENRASTMEQFVRNNIIDGKKQQTGVFISMGLAVFSAIVSMVINLF